MIGRASSAMPRLAPQDSRNPTWWSRNGSTSSSPIAASTSTRDPVVGRPSAPAIIATTAIVIARSTDGSQRVMVPKHTSTTNATTTRPRSPDRRSSGANSASTNATFSPETAVRCVSPAARNCSVSASGTPRVSPSRKPASSARSTGCRCVDPACTSPRNPLARRSRGARAAPDADDLGGVHLPHRVLPPPADVEALQLGAPAPQHHRFAGREDPQVRGDVARGAHEHASPTGAASVERDDAHEHARVEATGIGIVDERRDHCRVGVVHDRRRKRRDDQPVQRALHHARAEQRHRHARRPRCATPASATNTVDASAPTPSASTRAARRGSRAPRRPGSRRSARPGRRSVRPAAPAPGSRSVQTVTSGASSAKRLSPMPRTLRRSLTDVNPPRRCRSATIASA